ncbi:MAG: LVIVD repeat-containing protein [Thermoplasmatota archaeon]
MRRRVLLAALFVLAGCVQVQSPSGPVGAVALPIFTGTNPLVQDHAHNDPSLHNASFNVELVAHVTPWGDGLHFGNGSANELALRGGYAYEARGGPEGGFAIFDIADPTHPFKVGEYSSEGCADIEVTADGNFAFCTTQRTTPAAGDLAADPNDHTPRGVYIVNVQDKSRPTLESFFALPVNGPHTSFYYRDTNGTELLSLETYDLTTTYAPTAPFAALPGTHAIYLTQFVVGPDGKHTLRLLSRWSVPEVPPQGKQYFPHDVFIERHPVTHRLLLYAAYWDAGLQILDITDPTNPTRIGEFHDFTPSALAQLHDVRAFPTLIDGRYVVAVAPEIVTAQETGQMTFIDATDPTHPTKLGHWSLPGHMVVDSPFDFSPHNFDIAPNGLVYLAHYHAGVWVLDASSLAKMRDPPIVGFYQPHIARPHYGGIIPDVWSARVDGDYFYASDIPTGLYVLRLASGLPAGPAPGALQ